MKIFVSAGETSSDIHSANILKIFSEKLNLKPEIFGLGGDALRALGAELMVHNREFSVMGGPSEIIGKLPKRKKFEAAVEQRLLNDKIDFALLVDNGEINLRLAALLKFFGVPVVYYIPPKVWIWRHARIEKIKQHVDLVLSILPFEEPIYREWEIPFLYVGNPVLDEVDLKLTKQEACKKLEIDEHKKYITIFFGSRHSEVRYHVDLFSKAMQIFCDKIKDVSSFPEVLIPVAPAIDEDELKEMLSVNFPQTLKVHFYRNSSLQHNISHYCLAASHAGIIKSGTSTLEAAVLQVPMVLSYKGASFSHFLYKALVRYKGFVGLVNLFLVQPPEVALGWSDQKGTPVVPELILNDAKPEKIAHEFFKIYSEGKERQEMLEHLSKAKDLLKSKSGRSSLEETADALIRFWNEHKKGNS